MSNELRIASKNRVALFTWIHKNKMDWAQKMQRAWGAFCEKAPTAEMNREEIATIGAELQKRSLVWIESIDESDNEERIIGVLTANHFYWDEFHSAAEVEQYLSLHPETAIFDEYDQQWTSEEFAQAVAIRK